MSIGQGPPAQPTASADPQRRAGDRPQVPVPHDAGAPAGFVGPLAHVADRLLEDVLNRLTETGDPDRALALGLDVASRWLGAEQATMLTAPDPAPAADVGSEHQLRAELCDGRGHAVHLVRAARPFTDDERHLGQAYARVLGMTVRFLDVVATERSLRAHAAAQAVELEKHQQHTERLLRIQRTIARRASLDDVLEAIVTGARDLLGDEVVGLRLRDPSDPGHLMLVAHVGVPEVLVPALRSQPADQGLGGKAYTTGGPVTTSDYANDVRAMASFAAAGLKAGMAVPIFADGALLGSLTVATYEADRTYARHEVDLLVSLAEHVGIALANAHTLDALQEALSDPLTGLPNRSLLVDRLNQAIDRARRGGNRVAVLFIDLDRFKHVNDSLGHAVGDDLLCVAANRIRDAVRDADTTARLGGDEFVVVLDDLSERDAAYAAQRILERLRQPVELGGRTIYVGASVGIALAGDPDDDAETLIRHADIAMYRAKAAGKDRYVLFEESMHAEVVERLELEAELRAAVAAGDIEVHVQPVVEVATGRLHGVEALARWTSPTRGDVPAPLFIDLAEDSGSIVELDRCVIAKACRVAAPWCDPHTGAGVALHVNVSSRQLETSDFPAFLMATLGACGLEPDRLVLEITESQVMRDAPGTVDRLRAMKALGVRLAIDDFGTGYSSLAYLNQFPIDILKIDRSFITNLTVAPQGARIAQAILQLARALNLEVVAEGVETEEQAALLAEMGCELAQGFHYARPMAPADFQPQLAASPG